MKRRFLNALLFGALLVAAPAGTFVSCSDYDDDITSLQDQITTNATDLEGMVNEKMNNVQAEIDALEKADDDLKAAIEKAKTDTEAASLAAAQDLVNKAKEDLEKALADAQKTLEDAQATQAGQIEALLQVEGRLQPKIDDAQKKAEDAYGLALQVQTTANENKGKLEDITTRLGEVEKTLGEQKTAISNNYTELLGKINGLTTALTAQETALKTQITNGLADKADKSEITGLQDQINTLKNAGHQTAAEVQSAIDAAIATLVEEGAVNDVKTDLETLKNLVEGTAANPGIQQKLATAETNITTLQGQVSDLDAKINAIDGVLNVLFTNLSNLVTGIILQDDQHEFLYGQVVAGSQVNHTNISDKTFYEQQPGGQTLVYFPYKGAVNNATSEDAKENLISGNYNVEKNGGLIYVTLNPTNITFDNGVNLALENSLADDTKNKPETATGKVTLGKPEASKEHLITRAAEEEEQPKNGLYMVRLSYENIDKTKAPAEFANDYAVYTGYKTTVSEKKEENGKFTGYEDKVVEKKVYSKYALKLATTVAVRQTNGALVCTNADASYSSPFANYRITGADDKAELVGKFNLTPVTGKNEKAGTDGKVYRKYVEIVEVRDARNQEVNNATTKAAILKAVNDQNPNALNVVLTEPADKPQADDEANGFDRITVTVPDAYNGYTFTFRYYYQNYDGTIYAQDKSVLFTKVRFVENKVTMTHTPTQAGNQETPSANSAFNAQATCVTNAANRKLWVDNTASMNIRVQNQEAGIKSIHFYNNAAVPVLQQSATFVNGDATISGLSAAAMGQIYNMTITYNPAELELHKTYNLTIDYLDTKGNLVSTMPVEFTMEAPTVHDNLISPNPLYFTPFDANLTKLNGETFVAWALYDAQSGMAYYDLKAGFNSPRNDNDACQLRFDLDHSMWDAYSPGGDYAAYAPSNNTLTATSGNYVLYVPSAAVLDKNNRADKQEEHVYPMGVAVQYYGVPSLWDHPQPFKLVYKSAIAHANFKFNSAVYEVSYPSGEKKITDSDITADDPSTSVTDDIKYFTTGAVARDARIKSTDIELVDKQYRSVFDEQNTKVLADGINIKTVEDPQGATGAITGASIHFNFIVEDYFGNKEYYPFVVKIQQNASSANRK